MQPVILDGNSLSIEQVVAVARDWAKVAVADAAREKAQRSRDLLEKLVAEDVAIYGVTTGIGELARVRISPEQSAELSRRIIYSHSAGVGEFFPEDSVRAAMLLRLNVLSRGCSGVRLNLIDTVADMINKGVIPAINEKGSLGVSGDLSPMSQFAEVAIGEGRAFYKGELMSGAEAMKRAGVKPTDLTFKEGLGLINGSQMMTGGAALLIYDAERILKNALIASAMTLDALRAVERAFDPAIHCERPYGGQNCIAANLLRSSRAAKLWPTRPASAGRLQPALHPTGHGTIVRHARTRPPHRQHRGQLRRRQSTLPPRFRPVLRRRQFPRPDPSQWQPTSSASPCPRSPTSPNVTSTACSTPFSPACPTF